MSHESPKQPTVEGYIPKGKEQIAQKLLVQEHVLSVSYAPLVEQQINGEQIGEHFEKIKDSIPSGDEKLLSALVKYIEAPTVTIDFFSFDENEMTTLNDTEKEHEIERRDVLKEEWEVRQLARHPEVKREYSENRLKWRILKRLFQVLDFLPGIQEETEKEAQRLFQSDFFKNYSYETDLERQKKFTQQVADVARRAYQDYITHLQEQKKGQ